MPEPNSKESSSKDPSSLPDYLREPLNARLRQLQQQIERHTGEIAKERQKTKDKQNPSRSDSEEAVLEDMTHALAEALGQRVPIAARTRWDKFFDWFPPFTCLSFVLCIAFGTLGFLAMSGRMDSSRQASSSSTGTPAKDLQSLASGFLDVSKIFAGAIVGSTASVALSAAKAAKGKGQS
jgi:hypothetical protein